LFDRVCKAASGKTQGQAPGVGGSSGLWQAAVVVIHPEHEDETMKRLATSTALLLASVTLSFASVSPQSPSGLWVPHQAMPAGVASEGSLVTELDFAVIGIEVERALATAETAEGWLQLANDDSDVRILPRLFDRVGVRGWLRDDDDDRNDDRDDDRDDDGDDRDDEGED
jgi:hypothetical protein